MVRIYCEQGLVRYRQRITFCEDKEMKVFLSKAPNVLLESVEMLYAYVNEIPVRELAGKEATAFRFISCRK